jgi:NitT/TauT family transport system substrate-binding protein
MAWKRLMRGVHVMKRKFIRFLIRTLYFAALVAVLAACGTNSGGNGGSADARGNDPENRVDLTTIVYAQLKPSLTDIHTEFGKERGIYEKYGIDLDVIHFDGGGPEALAGVAGGDIDMGNFGTPILTGISRGVPIKVVGSPAITENPFVLVGGPKVQTMEEVKGKILGTGKLGGGNHQTALKILEKYGISQSEVDIRPVGDVDAYLLLKQGAVDAIVTTEPDVTRIERAGIGQTLVKGVDINEYQNYQHSFVFASDELIKNKPDIVRAVLAGHKETIQYVKDHTDELVAYASEKLGYEADLVRDFYDKIIPTWNMDGSVNVEGTLHAFDILKELGEIDQHFDTSEANWLDERFITKE